MGVIIRPSDSAHPELVEGNVVVVRQAHHERTIVTLFPATRY
jgi:hypothetical protein